MKKIDTLEDLKKLAGEETGVEVFIQLNYGLRSSKHVAYNEGTDYWHILNEIDDSEQELHTPELATETNIMEALEKGALYQYEY